MPAYAELNVTSNYSFLRGASHPHELVGQAAALGLDAIAIADRNSLAGIVRAHQAVKDLARQNMTIRLVVGARLITQEGFGLLYFPTDLAAYSRLSRLLTLGNRRAEKGQCRIFLDDVLAHAQGGIALALPPLDPGDQLFAARLALLAEAFPRRCFVGAHHLYRGDDRRRLARLSEIAAHWRTPLVAGNDVHYHSPERRALQDIQTCIRHGCTIEQAGFRLFANAERHLKPPEEMSRLFAAHPGAIERTIEIAAACRFSLDELRYQYPIETGLNGITPQQELERLTWLGASQRYPEGVPGKVRDLLRHELALIGELNYAPYFLTVHDIVLYARSRDILCQGRGSAANSAVCYCLGITAIDPARIDVLFERFISAARNEPPDIDVDFEHERREEVIQYIYNRYGRERAGLAATVIAYRSRSAIRDVGKALGLSPDTVGTLADTVWGSSGAPIARTHVKEAGLDPLDRRLALALEMAAILSGFPRHLSQHVGGFVITAGRLDDLVPIGNAAMEDRTVIEWDKDDLDTLRILKIDVLALGMLTCIRKGFELIARHHGRALTLASVPAEDPAVYDMLCRADSLGVFQVESRAQMSMLPRLKPRNFYDLVIEVAIVRPGPIQGDMVHPYLRRRNGEETVEYPSEALRQVLEKTLGVPLFQEQAMKIAIVAAGFTPGEADQLRRAMATFRRNGQIDRFRDKMIDGMIARGYQPDFAERCFRQIEGFGDYGFPESHAASFALLVYVSAWIKCHYPAAFAAALLNSQPMGFYAPAQIVRDAREHGVEVRPPDANLSGWDCSLESARVDGRPTNPINPGREESPALRLGLREIKGFDEEDARKLMAARSRPFADMRDLWRRTGLKRVSLEKLAHADACRSMKLDRRQALWVVRGLRDQALPLLDPVPQALANEPAVALPAMALPEQVVEDYASIRMSLRCHPLALLRGQLARERILQCARLAETADGSRVAVCGLVLVRQRPGTASGVVFITLEDETGIANIIVWASMFERFRRAAMGARLLRVDGKMQREGLVIHIVAERLTDLSARLDALAEDKSGSAIDVPTGRGDESRHGSPDRRPPDPRPPNPQTPPRRIDPRSRDFH